MTVVSCYGQLWPYVGSKLVLLPTIYFPHEIHLQRLCVFETSEWNIDQACCNFFVY